MTTNTQRLAYTPGPDKLVPADLLTLPDVPNPGPPLQLAPTPTQRRAGYTLLALGGAFSAFTLLLLLLAFVETAGIAWATIPTTFFAIITTGAAHRVLVSNYTPNRAIMAERASTLDLYDHYKPGRTQTPTVWLKVSR